MNEKQPPPTPELPHDYYEDEIDLVDIFSVLWRQRWFIAGVTMFFVALAVIYVFVKTPLYQVTAQISPGITGYDRSGNALYKNSPDDIIAWFSEKIYAESLGENEEDLPEINAKAVSKTDSVKIDYYCKDPTEGNSTLSTIIDSLAEDGAKSFKRELNVQKNILEQKIHEKTKTINILMLDQDRIKSIDQIKINNQIENTNARIILLNKKIETIRKNRVNAQNVLENSKKKIDSVNKNTEEIMALRQQMITDDADKIALLMYSNIIQQNISFANSLQRQTLDLKKEVNIIIDAENDHVKQIDYFKTQILDLKLDRDESMVLRNKEAALDIEQQKIDIQVLKSKISNLSIIQIIKAPVRSNQSVKPDKLKIVMLSFIIGIFLAVLLSFLRNFWINNKVRITEKACK